MADYSLDLFTTRNPFLGLSPQPYSTRGDRLARNLSLQALQQRNELGAIDVQNAKDDQAKRQRVAQIWQESGGDIEKAIPLIMQVDPILGDKLRQNEFARQATEREAAMQNYKLQEGQPAPERQVGTPGTYTPPNGIPEGETSLGQRVTPQQAPIPSGFTQEMPTPSVQIPGVGGVPGFTAKPQSQQDIFRKMQAEAQAKADIQRNANTYTITDPTTGRTITAPKDIIDNVITQLGENYRLQNKPTAVGTLPTTIQEYNLYAQQEKEAGRKPVSFDTWQTRDANRKATSVNGNEPLVSIVGSDGKAVLVPRSQAVGKTPFNVREQAQGRPVISADANRIADFNTGLDNLKELRGTIPAGTTGALAQLGAWVPKPITSITGIGTEAKQKQAIIDRVKQIIGKTLEGGVLRKEDEVKYEKILPTIGDTAEVVQTKISGLEGAIQRKREAELNALEDAGYDVSKYKERGPGGTKQLDETMARNYLQKAGGDKNKARAMARQDGYTF